MSEVRFDNLPEHFSWKCNEKELSSPIVEKNDNFLFYFIPSIEKKDISFSEALNSAIEKTLIKSNGKTIAICASGGIDSEIIARKIVEHTKNVELYFLSNWGLNNSELVNFVQPLSKELEVKLNVVELSFEYFYEEFAASSYLKYGCYFPTYLAMLFLFSQIPKDCFIVVGEGDLEKGGPAYSRLYNLNKKNIKSPT